MRARTCPELTNDISVRYDVSSSWFDPMRYPTWSKNIQACYALLNTNYQIPDSQPQLREVGLPMPELRIAIGAPFVEDAARPLTLAELQNIAIAIVHFEDQFQETSQRFFRRRICQDNPKFKGKNEANSVTMIRRTKNAQQLCDLLNPPKGGPWFWEFSKADSIVHAVAETFYNANECIEKIAPIITFVAACFLIRDPAEVMAYQKDQTGLTQFISTMEARYREPAMDSSRFAQPTMEQLSNPTPRPAPAKKGGFFSRAMPTRNRG